MYFDDEEDDEHIQSTEEAMQLMLNLIRWLYFDYMINEKFATFKEFKKIYLTDKYLDHVESHREDLYGKKTYMKKLLSLGI